jgi:hypothetical protein
MSKSFAIVNGDLVIDAGRSFGIVSGRDKLLQDLRLWVLEKLGIDPATPTYGNRLEGSANEQNYSGFVGALMTTDNLHSIRNIVIDMLQRYQSMQFEKIRGETLRYVGKNTLDEEEILQSIDSVEVINFATTALVQVVITTLGGTGIRLTIPVSA